MNQFGDLSETEFKLLYANLIVPDSHSQSYSKKAAKKIELEKEDCLCKIDNQFEKMSLEMDIEAD